MVILGEMLMRLWMRLHLIHYSLMEVALRLMVLRVSILHLLEHNYWGKKLNQITPIP